MLNTAHHRHTHKINIKKGVPTLTLLDYKSSWGSTLAAMALFIVFVVDAPNLKSRIAYFFKF